jgi:hypothetical protein
MIGPATTARHGARRRAPEHHEMRTFRTGDHPSGRELMLADAKSWQSSARGAGTAPAELACALADVVCGGEDVTAACC